MCPARPALTCITPPPLRRRNRPGPLLGQVTPLATLVSLPSHAQTFPNRPVRVLVPLSSRQSLNVPVTDAYYADYWARVEELRIPLTWHVNDPEEFWDPDRIPGWAKERSWGYGPGDVQKEELYAAYVRSGNPAEEVMRYARENDVDMIVIGSAGHSAVERMMFGSTAEKVVRGAHCSVLVVRPPAAAS